MRNRLAIGPAKVMVPKANTEIGSVNREAAMVPASMEIRELTAFCRIPFFPHVSWNLLGCIAC